MSWLRRTFLGLSTIAGRPRGFFIPYRYARAVPMAGERPPYAWLEAAFREQHETFTDGLKLIDGLAEFLNAIDRDSPPQPRWTQSWFPRLDAAIAYALVHTGRPRRIVEVGSGHSTRFMARAVADGKIDASFLAIDPAPRADIAGLNLKLIRKPVHEIGPEPFRALSAGDILFIDSSHILMPGTDVDFLLNRILPALAPGVMVHIHDIFLPDDYPAGWAWRGYNEQLGVACLLGAGGWRVVFSSHYVVTRMAGDFTRSFAATLPLLPEARESSLWLVRGV